MEDQAYLEMIASFILHTLIESFLNMIIIIVKHHELSIKDQLKLERKLELRERYPLKYLNLTG